MVTPDWSQPFEIMCNASNVAVGAIMGQRKDKMFRHLYYERRTLNNAQVNYATTENELFAVVFAFDKFRSYLMGSKVIPTFFLVDKLPRDLSRNQSRKLQAICCTAVQVYDNTQIRTTYHAQTSGKVEVANRKFKRILEKTASTSRKDCSVKLDEALWAYKTALKTTVGISLFKLVYEKSFYLLVEIEHKAYWAIKMLNLVVSRAGEHMLAQMNELEEFRQDTYENA
ncbi:uncharacterized protein [Nicotiana sylvestris]|uniref:uncharacterized protein n=1 Tax=Nicotiana sylvestris TaxID=4096 RepID=UPI00388C6104